jgi:hypothetical protein
MAAMRLASLAIVLYLVPACTAEITHDVDLQHANARAALQTYPSSIAVFAGDVEQPYDVLADLEVTVRQRSSFGEMPTPDHVMRALQMQAGKIGAHAIILVAFGELGASLWTWHELRGHGRAIRFR